MDGGMVGWMTGGMEGMMEAWRGNFALIVLNSRES